MVGFSGDVVGCGLVETGGGAEVGAGRVGEDCRHKEMLVFFTLNGDLLGLARIPNEGVRALSLSHSRTHAHTHTRAHRTHASTGPLVVTLFFVKLFFVTPFVTLFAELALSIWYRVLSFLRTLPCPLSFLSIFSLALFL